MTTVSPLTRIAVTRNRRTITVTCTPTEAANIEATLSYVEGWPDDEDRVRFVYKDGRKSGWFSRYWSRLTYQHVAPRRRKQRT